MEITKEIAQLMYNSEIEKLVDFAIQVFPEIDTRTTKQGELFSTLQKEIAKINKARKLNLRGNLKVSEYYPMFYYTEEKVFSFKTYCWGSPLVVPYCLCFIDKEDCNEFVKNNLQLYKKLYEEEMLKFH